MNPGTTDEIDLLITSARVGNVEHLPPGCVLGECSACRAATWIDLSAGHIARMTIEAGRHAVPLCFGCADAGLARLDRRTGLFGSRSHHSDSKQTHTELHVEIRFFELDGMPGQLRIVTPKSGTVTGAIRGDRRALAVILGATGGGEPG